MEWVAKKSSPLQSKIIRKPFNAWNIFKVNVIFFFRCFHLEEHLPVEQLIVAGDEVPPVAAVEQLRLLGLGLCNTGSNSHSIVILLEPSTTLLEVPQLTVYQWTPPICYDICRQASQLYASNRRRGLLRASLLNFAKVRWKLYFLAPPLPAAIINLPLTYDLARR